MQEILDRYKTGISISQVTMQQAQPPEQVQAAFDDAVKANQDRERQINEGQAYANDVVPKARGTASRLMQEAEGYKQRVIANAEGEASRFRQIQAEYSRAPAVTRERIYLETMQQVSPTPPRCIVDQKGGNNLLFLPLDKIMQMSASGARRRPSPHGAGLACRAASRGAPRSGSALARRLPQPRPGVTPVNRSIEHGPRRCWSRCW